MKVVLVSESDGLGNYLATKAGIEIIAHYTNLYSIKDELYKKMTVADRLLYICTNKNQTFTKDLNTITELLRNYSELFRFDEIIFYIEKSPNNSGYPQFVERVFQEFPNQKYTVPVSTLKIAFPDAYQVLLGKTDAVLNTESRERIFIKPKGSTVSSIYNESGKTTLEPFDYSVVEEYDKLKRESVRNDSGRIIQDLDQDEIQLSPSQDKPYLGSYEFQPNLGEKNIILVTGGKACGATTYNNALAISTSKANKNTMIVNMTDDGMYAQYLVDLGAPFGLDCYEYSIKNMILKKEFEFRNHLCTLTMHEVSDNLRIDALRYFLKNSYRINSDYIFIEVPLSLVEEVARLVRHRLCQIFYVCESVAWEIEKALPNITTLADTYPLLLWLNNQTRVRYKDDWLEMGEVMEMTPNNIEIIDSITFEDYNIDDGLYVDLLGGDDYV